MQREQDIALVRDILLGFADRTGITDSDTPPRRYLWTDAHAVCTLLGLDAASGDVRYRDLALALIDQVHEVLGRHRDDDPRSGWISGLGESEGRAHPTAGGLRIGKPLAERPRSEPLDERLEWDRDGQYFHYLTKWMHALCRAAAVTGREDYARFAHELAEAAYAGFVTPRGDGLYWKMSVDLSFPQVASSGHHDPLDGYITCREIEHVAAGSLGRLPARFAAMLAGRDWATADPLGIGGLLFDAGRVVRLTAAGQMDGEALASGLLAAASVSLAAFTRSANLRQAADFRLAFRELGLSIGLRGVETMIRVVSGPDGRKFDPGIHRELDGLERYEMLADSIESFWREPTNRQVRSWREHADINEVMLATSLLPDEFLAA